MKPHLSKDKCPRCSNKWKLIDNFLTWYQCFPCKLNYYDTIMNEFELTIQFDQFKLHWSWNFNDCSIPELKIFNLPWYSYNVNYKQIKNTLAFI
jgi:hypothetical protein